MSVYRKVCCIQTTLLVAVTNWWLWVCYSETHAYTLNSKHAFAARDWHRAPMASQQEETHNPNSFKGSWRTGGASERWATGAVNQPVLPVPAAVGCHASVTVDADQLRDFRAPLNYQTPLRPDNHLQACDWASVKRHLLNCFSCFCTQQRKRDCLKVFVRCSAPSHVLLFSTRHLDWFTHN